MAKPLINCFNVLNSIITARRVNAVRTLTQVRCCSQLVKSVRSDESNLSVQIEDGDELPAISPTYNLSKYVKDSTNLQQFIKLGVDLHKIEKRKGLAQFMLEQEYNENIPKTLLFLQDQGVQSELLGQWLTKNPLILKEDLDTLQTRIDYLTKLNLTKDQIARIISLNPFWLMFSTDRIERRLGFIQRNFALKTSQVLKVAVKQSRLITYNLEHIRQATFCFREEMGFESAELKKLLLKKPRLFMMHSNDLVERFAYAQKEMQVSHEVLLDFPELLTSRLSRLRDRHEFLQLIGRAQYNPKHDLYVPLNEVVSGNDAAFCRYVAKCELQVYESFLRTR